MQNEKLYLGKIQDIIESIKNTEDYFRRYIENCKNPDTILMYHSEVAKKLILNQKNTLDILTDMYQDLKELLEK